MTAIIVAPGEVIETRTTDGEGPAAHIVLIPPHLKGKTTPQGYVLAARIEGFPIEALCGKTWIPERDPKPLPVCQPCMDIYHQPGDHRDSRDEAPDA